MTYRDYRPRLASDGAGSFAAINGHPIHPLLVPVVIGMYVAATCADVGFARSGDVFWARSTAWLLLGTLVAGLIAAIPGIIDLLSIDRARHLPLAWAHAGGNALFLMVTALNYAERQPDPAHSSGGLVLTFTGLALLIVSGWLGGEMTFRHGIGMSAPSLEAASLEPDPKIASLRGQNGTM